MDRLRLKIFALPNLRPGRQVRSVRRTGLEGRLPEPGLGGPATPGVEQVNDNWYYRRSIPLSNTFHPNCVLCHANFTPEFFNSTNNPGQWVGTLLLRVPIKSNED